jgi:hypothetical protein
MILYGFNVNNYEYKVIGLRISRWEIIQSSLVAETAEKQQMDKIKHYHSFKIQVGI